MSQFVATVPVTCTIPLLEHPRAVVLSGSLLAVGVVTLFFLDNDSLAEITKKKRVDAKQPTTQANATREGNKARRRTLPGFCIGVSKSTGA